MTVSVLITSFGPFGPFRENPSQLIMEELQRAIPREEQLSIQWAILPVSYREVDAFVQDTAQQPPDWAFHLGVAGGSRIIRLETLAQNLAKGADIHAHDPGGEPITLQGEDLGTTIPQAPLEAFQ